jgi:NAD(P)H dehydrogenase (quinone)
MINVLIVYATSYGNTKRMAEAVADGARSVKDAEVSLKESHEVTKNDVRTCDALVIGSPIRHRTADARIKQFIEDVCEQLWLTDEMVGKVGGVFTVGGGYGDCGAGCELAQLGLYGALAAGGMILATLPKTTPGFQSAGMHWGPHGRSGGPGMEPIGITEDMILAGWHHGANVTRIAAELKGKDLLARGNVAPSKELVELFMS